jgi:hypothetical protein
MPSPARRIDPPHRLFYIVLSARVLKLDLFIVSRAVDDSSVPKLIRAGANRAISPYAIGGRRLAHLILSPAVADFFDTVIRKGEESLNLECIKVRDDARVVGLSLAELGRPFWSCCGKTAAAQSRSRAGAASGRPVADSGHDRPAVSAEKPGFGVAPLSRVIRVPGLNGQGARFSRSPFRIRRSRAWRIGIPAPAVRR